MQGIKWDFVREFVVEEAESQWHQKSLTKYGLMPRVNPSLTANDVDLIPKTATSRISLSSEVQNVTEL